MFVSRRAVTMISVILLLMFALVPAQAQTTTSTCSGVETTLASEGTPNLYRLGIKYGVPWQDIQAASGVEDVRRVLPDQVLCVPGASASLADTTTTTVTTVIITVVTPVATATPIATATPVASGQPVFTEAGYCAPFMNPEVPIDLGSCQLELLSIQAGVQSIVEWGIECEPRVVRLTEAGTYQQCSVRGDLWLSTSAPIP